MASIFDTELVKWAGVLLAAPVAFGWKRAVGAVQKEELQRALDAVSKNHDEIFSRLNEVAQSTARIECSGWRARAPTCVNPKTLSALRTTYLRL